MYSNVHFMENEITVFGIIGIRKLGNWRRSLTILLGGGRLSYFNFLSIVVGLSIASSVRYTVYDKCQPIVKNMNAANWD